MATKYDAVIKLLMDNKDFLRDSKKSSKAVDKTGKSAKNAERSFGSLAKKAALTFGAGGAIIGILKWADAGSDLAIQAALVAKSMDQVLGPASDRLVSQNKDLASSMGLTVGELEKAILPLAQVGSSMGLAADENEAFLSALFKGAADIAVFNGEIGGTAEVMENLQSATRGEFDALQKYVPSINAAAVAQKAMEQTGKDSAAELTDLEKLTATYTIVLDEMAKTQGAANDAMEDGVLAQQDMNTQMREAQTTVGAVAAETKGNLALALGKVFDLFNKIGESIGNAIVGFRMLADTGPPVIREIADLLQGFLFFISGAKGGFQQLGSAIGRVGSSIGRVIAKIKSIPRSIPNPFRNLRIPSFQTGGTVPGPKGSAQLIKAHGGEQVLTAQQQRQRGGGGGGGGMVVNVKVEAGLNDPQSIAREIVDLLTLFNRTNGAIPIEVSSGSVVP